MALEGKTIRLREERMEDQQLFTDLRNTLDTQGFTKSLPPDYTLGMHEKRHQNREFSYDRKDARFIIEMIETGEAAGNIGYYGLETRHDAIVGIAISKAYWRAGIAFEAQELLLQFLFEELGLHAVRLWTNSGNPQAVKLAERSGFQVALRQRESVFRRGKLWDNLVMDILRDEYYALHLELTDGLA